MQRKAHHKLWTLILMLLLCGASFAPTARVARADTTPLDPSPGAPPADPHAGDPDSPDTGRSLPKPGSHRGAREIVRDVSATRQGSFGIWMLRIRTAFASVYRFLFRF